MAKDLINQTLYYRRFKIIIGSPLWRIYLKRAYRKCIEGLRQLNFVPDFNKKDFTCLLSGAGNETTADEFIKFVIARNRKAGIIIIDIGDEQIEAVKRLVQNKYQSLNIKVKQINALDLTSFIQKNNIDWIETDGFLEYFNTESLDSLLNVWNKILKKNGFITLREFASDGMIGKLIDYFRLWIAKKWLGVTIYIHTKKGLEDIFKKNNFKFVSGSTLIPTFKRYSLIRNLR
ncbi:hypothetical protein HY612_02195 [Candidatus Roizmanbacteria bacterium]|nr:hypothetical protein [Candidatus Roizmanbacteria bacterium]